MSTVTTNELIDSFAQDLKKKMHAAEAKYGFNDNWMREGWREELIQELYRHIIKGDPRDVAIYCAFAWSHGWSLNLDERPSND